MDWVTWVIQTAVLLAIGIIGFLLKQMMNKINEDNQRNAKRIDAIEEEMKRLPFMYTLRDDFIRAMAGVESKLNKILDKLSDRPER